MLPHEKKLLGEGAYGGSAEYMPWTFQSGPSYGSKGYRGPVIPGKNGVSIAKTWAQSAMQGRGVSPAVRGEWEEYAMRQALTQDEIEKGWKFLRAKHAMGEALRRLKALPEATSWWGYSVPNPLQVKTTHQPSGGADLQANQQAMGFPFHTRAAEMVLKKAIELIGLYPNKSAKELIGIAVNKSGISVTNLTPEDSHLLNMAVSWAQNGKSGVGFGNRIAGMPGGPFRSSSGHSLGQRGAP
jgi:hypothetical protein